VTGRGAEQRAERAGVAAPGARRGAVQGSDPDDEPGNAQRAGGESGLVGEEHAAHCGVKGGEAAAQRRVVVERCFGRCDERGKGWQHNGANTAHEYGQRIEHQERQPAPQCPGEQQDEH